MNYPIPSLHQSDVSLRAEAELLRAVLSGDDGRLDRLVAVLKRVGRLQVIHDSVVYEFPEGVPAESISGLLDILQRRQQE